MDTQATKPNAPGTNETPHSGGGNETIPSGASKGTAGESIGAGATVQGTHAAMLPSDAPAEPAGSMAAPGQSPTGDGARAATTPWEPSAGTPRSERTPEQIEAAVIEALRTCFDPEIPVNIYDLGLIYSVQVDPPGAVAIRMTLTSPMCPVAGSLPPEVEAKVRDVAGVTQSKVDLVWDPPWGPNMMSEAAKLQLNI